MKLVTSQSDIPKESHWAVVTFDSLSVPGDERSRTNPGHGYPEYTHTYVTYRAFTDETEWKKYISRLVNHGGTWEKSFTAMRVIPAQVSTSVSIDVNTAQE